MVTVAGVAGKQHHGVILSKCGERPIRLESFAALRGGAALNISDNLMYIVEKCETTYFNCLIIFAAHNGIFCSVCLLGELGMLGSAALE